MATLKYQTTKTGLYLLLIAAISISFLFSPKVQQKDRGAWNMFELSPHMHFFIINDALDYVNLSMTPSDLMKPKQKRQARPLYVVQNSIFGEAFLWLSSPLHERMSNSGLFKAMGQSIIEVPGDLERREYTPYEAAVVVPVFYFAHVLSNILILLVSLLLFESIWRKISDTPTTSVLFIVTCCMLLINLNVKMYFWTAHQQMFSILSPILCIWIGLVVLDGTMKSLSQLFALSFLGGVLMLYYGNFLLVLPSIVLPYLWKYRKEKTPVALLGACLVFVLGSAIPTLVWMALLKYHGVTYYNHEMVKYRQFIWVADFLSHPSVHAVKDTVYYIKNYLETSVVLAPVFIWLGIVGYLLGKGHLTGIRKNEQFIWVAGCILMYIIFFFFLGMYRYRLTYTIAVSLFCLTPFFIRSNNISTNKTILVSAFALVWFLYTLLSYGPFL